MNIKNFKNRVISYLIDFRIKRHVCNKFKNTNDKIRIADFLEYKRSRRAKGVVYTCITNDYDDIHEIEIYPYIDKDWDYVLFTDNEEQVKAEQIGIWEVKALKYTQADNTRNNRWHKLNPHLIFPDYEQSIYIDGNIVILTSHLFKLIEKRNIKFMLPSHFVNRCIYSEYEDVLDYKIDDENVIKKELDILKEAKMPANYGFCENNILYRKHNDELIKKIDEEWWNMVKNYSKRDQLSLCYLFWKYGIKINEITFKNSRLDNKNFYVMTHKRGRR